MGVSDTFDVVIGLNVDVTEWNRVVVRRQAVGCWRLCVLCVGEGGIRA